MLRRNLIFFSLIAFTTLIFLYSCQNDIVLEKPCTDEPGIPITKVYLSFTIDSINVLDSVNLDRLGFIYGDNVVIRSKNITRTAKIGGHICSDMKFYADVVYTDTVDNSRLRIQGALTSSILDVDILYCENKDNNCNYTKIGHAYGSYSPYRGFVTLFTPLFFGDVSYWGVR
ncbi:MAG: hypothetical protein EHM58_18615 [Ignavibacteriae bacterium]|nr:MAG: hypothetical protein EHM58_18615 [Ignavibacteriota bacterium]